MVSEWEENISTLIKKLDKNILLNNNYLQLVNYINEY